MARLSGLILVVVLVGLTVSTSAAVELWAIDVRSTFGGNDYAFTFDPDNPVQVPAAYPGNEFKGIWGAAYEAAASTLYISGTYPDTHWESSAIAIYHGGPGGLEFVSASSADLEGYNWAAGIEYLNGNLYGIAYDEFSTGNNLFFRIDNPGVEFQTATQIGPALGLIADMGNPYALCSDGQGGMFAGFNVPYDMDQVALLYRIDVETGGAIHLQTYSHDDLPSGSGTFESLEYADNRLFGLMTSGHVYEIDTGTFDATPVWQLTRSMWTCLVAVPEPSSFILLGSGISFLLIFRKRT